MTGGGVTNRLLENQHILCRESDPNIVSLPGPEEF